MANYPYPCTSAHAPPTACQTNLRIVSSQHRQAFVAKQLVGRLGAFDFGLGSHHCRRATGRCNLSLVALLVRRRLRLQLRGTDRRQLCQMGDWLLGSAVLLFASLMSEGS